MDMDPSRIDVPAPLEWDVSITPDSPDHYPCSSGVTQAVLRMAGGADEFHVSHGTLTVLDDHHMTFVSDDERTHVTVSGSGRVSMNRSLRDGFGRP